MFSPIEMFEISYLFAFGLFNVIGDIFVYLLLSLYLFNIIIQVFTYGYMKIFAFNSLQFFS